MTLEEMKQLAAKMLSVDEVDLNPFLVEVLTDLDIYVCNIGTEVTSRQIVALAVVIWKNKMLWRFQ